MIADFAEQRNPYKGTPPRAWIRLRLVGLDGNTGEVELMADTGSPCAVIVSAERMRLLMQGNGPDLNTNFGPLTGGWMEVIIPEFGPSQFVQGYASDEVVAAAKRNCADFDGLAGLPLLRTAEYGGNAHFFWLLPPQGAP